MNQYTEEFTPAKDYMLRTKQESMPPHINVLLTEADILDPLTGSSALQGKSHKQRWWTEERLALLTLVLGNAFFFALVLRWLF
jgi:hypothetical protein